MPFTMPSNIPDDPNRGNRTPSTRLDSPQPERRMSRGFDNPPQPHESGGFTPHRVPERPYPTHYPPRYPPQPTKPPRDIPWQKVLAIGGICTAVIVLIIGLWVKRALISSFLHQLLDWALMILVFLILVVIIIRFIIRLLFGRGGL